MLPYWEARVPQHFSVVSHYCCSIKQQLLCFLMSLIILELNCKNNHGIKIGTLHGALPLTEILQVVFLQICITDLLCRLDWTLLHFAIIYQLGNSIYQKSRQYIASLDDPYRASLTSSNPIQKVLWHVSTFKQTSYPTDITKWQSISSPVLVWNWEYTFFLVSYALSQGNSKVNELLVNVEWSTAVW